MTTTEMSKAAGPPESVGKPATEGETSNIQQRHWMPETVGMEANNWGVFAENRRNSSEAQTINNQFSPDFALKHTLRPFHAFLDAESVQH